MNKSYLGLVFIAILLMVSVGLSSSIFEKNDAGFLQIKQAALSGDLTCRLEPGVYGQMFGDIHTYPEAETYFFTAAEQTGQRRNESLPTRFNDGAKAQVSGSLRVILPRDCEPLVKLHRKFHSIDGVMHKLVLPAVRKALFSTGPHMSAGESYAERRGEFAVLAEDQLRNGVIMVDKFQEERPDPITGEAKVVWVLSKRDCDVEGGHCIGGFERDTAAFTEFAVGITNFVIDGIEYPQAVLAQIESQRQARMNVITQQAQAKEAEARAAKAEAEAKARIAETRAEEEVKKTQLVVKAEGERDQARLAKEAAGFWKEEQILRGQGEAERKKMVMAADGALAQKLEAWVKVNELYAAAISKYNGSWVPQVVMGQGGGASAASNGAQGFVDLLMAKTAQDLALDLKIKNARSNP